MGAPGRRGQALVLQAQAQRRRLAACTDSPLWRHVPHILLAVQVWIPLKILQSISLWLVWRSGRPAQELFLPLALFSTHLLLGNWWNVVFFGKHKMEESTGWMGAFWWVGAWRRWDCAFAMDGRRRAFSVFAFGIAIASPPLLPRALAGAPSRPASRRSGRSAPWQRCCSPPLRCGSPSPPSSTGTLCSSTAAAAARSRSEACRLQRCERVSSERRRSAATCALRLSLRCLCLHCIIALCKRRASGRRSRDGQRSGACTQGVEQKAQEERKS